MNAPCHRAITLAATLGACNITRPDFDHGAVFVGIAMLSAMAPDKLEMGFLEHRGPTHRWFAPLLFIAALCLLAAIIQDRDTQERPFVPFLPSIALGGLFGYGCHLLADGLTQTGLPAGKDKRWHLLPKGLRVTTGRGGELFVMLIAVCLSFAFVVGLIPDQTQAGDCRKPDRAVRLYLSKAKYPNVIAHIKESWREGYPHVLRINREGAERRRDRLLARWTRRHPQPKGDGLDLDERPAAMLRRFTFKASVKPIPASENRSEGSRMGRRLAPYCNGVRVMYVFTS